jgi:hypothetical protein
MKTKLTESQLQEVALIQERDGITRKSAIRKYQKQLKAATKVQAKASRKAAKTTPAPVREKLSPEEVSRNRKEGIRLFQLAGKPTPEQFVLVYGPKGPRLTWDQRVAAGVPAERFQAALAAKVGQKSASAGR